MSGRFGSREGCVAGAFAIVLGLVVAPGDAGAAGPEIPNGPWAFAPKAVRPLDESALAASIDRLVAAKWAALGASPSPRSDDAEFLRRVSLDVSGRIPTASEARAFLDDTDPDKRRKLVERLLAGPGFANHMTAVWKELLIPEAAGNYLLGFFAPDFEVWLRRQFANGVPYDVFVRELLTAPVANQGPFQARRPGAKTTPVGFFAAKDGKPENLAASASRLFLGVRIECAQCHNHPFAKWKREEFWGLAAFFSGIDRNGNGDSIFQATELPEKREIEMAGTKKVVPVGFLDGRDVIQRKGTPSRKVFAEWLTARDNPYFARAAANRFWAQFFGVGLVDPVDDMGASAEPSHPELLDLLADQFVAHDFDVRFLVRTLTATRVYQLSSAGGSPSGDVYRLFDRMAVRGLSPLQLYRSVMVATGLPKEPVPPYFSIGGDSPRRDFLERFASHDEKATERQTSILQALILMNGRIITDATNPKTGATLPAVADAPFLDTPGRIEALYLATLSRRPRPDELERLVPYVEGGGAKKESKEALAQVFWSMLGKADRYSPSKEALADVFWSILDSAEFVLNH